MLQSILFAWLSAALGLWVAAKMLPSVRLRSDADAIWAGALLGLLQALLTTPLFILLGLATLGIGFLLWFITTWIASALVIRITAALSSRLDVDGFLPALITAFVVSLAGSVVHWLLA
ncbi:MAG TPA: phage holin family protein [Polyangiales bacterium]|nr:phage holin family protein [Polyangiales bacterium]